MMVPPQRSTGVVGADDPTVIKLLAHAQNCRDKYDLDAALKFYGKALDRQPENTDLMDDVAEVCLSAGYPDKALQLLQRSIQLDPERNATKYLSAAQLLDGETSIGLFQKALALMQGEKGKCTDETTASELDKKMACTLASMSELYTTDLCDEEEAEKKAEALIEQALQIEGQCVEALVQKANLRICQQRAEEAKAILKEIVQRPNAQDSDPYSFDLRLTVGKLLVETGMSTEGVEWMESLVEGEEGLAEPWYVLAMAQKANGNKADAQQAIAEAMKCLSVDDDVYDEGMQQCIQALADEIGLPDNLDEAEGGDAMQAD